MNDKNMGWAVFVNDVRIAWFKSELIAEDMVDDIRRIDPYKDIYYMWVAK